MTMPARLSYGILALVLILAGWLHMGTLLLAPLFSYFALRKLYSLTKRKWLAFILFLIIVAGIACAAVYFTRAAWMALPEIGDKSIPPASAWAQARNIELPFADFESFRAYLINALQEEVHYLRNVAHFAGAVSRVLLLILIGIVVATSLFFRSRDDPFAAVAEPGKNLYAICSSEMALRFHGFYRSFATVMGAQITISLINTVLTAIFVLTIQLPYAPVAIAATFLCGLLPIIGNIISNSIIVFLAMTVSVKMALAALVFLIAIHKLEYFLNSKIIGQRIQNPVWLTLIALVLGEALMGIPGMILAPVVLNYLRVELSSIGVKSAVT